MSDDLYATLDTLEPDTLPLGGEGSALGLPARYELLGLLGQGGMGEVWRVRDTTLDRVMALKVLSGHTSPERVARLEREARLTAQLQHPGIPPVHDLGALPDGRRYFTMQEIRGTTLGQKLHEHHTRAEGAWPLRRLIDALQRASEAVACAHAQGVVHGDIKPGNIMLGAFGAVMVVDWGLAVNEGEAEGVRGTPRYMAPEQARGEPVTMACDVYGLGAVLFELLTGAPRVRGRSSHEVLAKLRAHEFISIDVLPGLGGECLPVLKRATDVDPTRRYADAQGVALALREVLEDARRREEARGLLRRAQDALPQVEPLRARAEALRAEAKERLLRVATHEPTALRAPAWALEDEAAALDAEAARIGHELRLGAEAALRHAPDLGEARDLLADLHRGALLEAEARSDAPAALEAARALRALGAAGQERFLRGQGALTLLTEPPGAEALLFRYEPVERRLVEVFERSLGRTPLHVPLEMGSYLLRLRHPDCEEVRYPVRVEREQQVTGLPPGASAPLPIPLPPAGSLGPEERYVPPGWFLSGGDTEVVVGEQRQRVWVDGFVITRHPVTQRAYVDFLNALVAAGQERLALRCVPRADPGVGEAAPPMLYGRDARGRFELVPDAEGDVWDPDYPVMKVDWHSARHYARWRADRDGLPWRLPLELEWAKAARGVDGRLYPWGDFYDHGWALTAASRPGRPLLAAVGDFPGDESPYGVRGMAGNVRDWCLDPFAPGGPRVVDGRAASPPAEALAPGAALPPETPALDFEEEDLLGRRAVRGGCFSAGPYWCRAAVRDWMAAGLRFDSVGFRLARSFPS